MVGKDIYFRIEISHASGLPADLCKNVFVTYSFKHEQNTVYSTEESKGVSTVPQFNYKKVHVFEKATSYIIDYIESGDVSFKVCASNDDVFRSRSKCLQTRT